MKLGHRRLLYLTFFLIFFTAGPFLILDTTGYRYNFKKNKLEKTGLLVLDSQPENASIFLNGKYQDKTPARLTKLLPDQYNVEIQKDGYKSWQQKLEVKSNLTTFDEDIVLFKDSLPIVKVEGEIGLMVPSPDQEKIIYSILKAGLEELRFLNLGTDLDLLIEQFATKTYDGLEFIAWSPKGNKALLKKSTGDFNQYLIIDIETLKTKELFNITRLNFDQVSWDQQNNDYLYATKGSVLYQIDLLQNLTNAIIADHIIDFMAQGKEIYYITSVGNESFINQIRLNDNSGQGKKIKLPPAAEFGLQPAPDGYLALLNKKNDDLFIISTKVFADENIDNNLILQAQAKHLSWSKNFKQFLYYTDFELWTYDLENNQSQLINRYGQTIVQAIWYPKNKYILYQAGDTINAIKVDEGNIKNDLELAKLENTGKLMVDQKGENIYLVGKIGFQQGILQLAIQ